MNQEVDYASDSDQSDEDFCPDKEAGISDAPSEEDSDDEVSGEDENQIEANKRRKTKVPKQVSSHIKKTTKRRNKKSKENTAESEDEDKNRTNRRSTRQVDDSNAVNKGATEKNELESDEEDKSRTDVLWADFLNDVKPAGSKSSTETVPTKSTNGTARPKLSEKSKPVETVPQKITVTEIVDFAGEEVRVEKEVNADSIKENNAKTKGMVMPRSSPRGLAPVCKRPAASGSGLGSILNQIGKKKKISVLEKTQLDWKSFKQNEGIEEELQTHNKGKDGYLERQDFLQRTDVRQFEIEKNLRQTKR